MVETQDTGRLAHIAFLLALSVLLFFLGLGTLGLTDQDEGRDAEAGREMLETRDWISPTFNYEPRLIKPVLQYWLMSGAYGLFGVSEFSARFPSAAFGVALILLQYVFLTRAAGPALALLSSLMLLLNVEIVVIGRLAKTDIVMMFFTTLAAYCFWLGLHGSTRLTTGAASGSGANGNDRSRHWFWGFYVAMALATLAKGPVGILIPLLAVIPYLTLTGQWGRFWRRGFPLAGIVLFLVLAVPWYAAMLTIHGSSYLSSGRAHTIGRFLNPMQGHGGTFLFYIPVLLLGFYPWSGFLPAALYQTLKNWRAAKGRAYDIRRATLPDTGSGQPGLEPPTASREPRRMVEGRTANHELELFAGVWLIAGFVLFSFSATRLPHYIGPLFPPAAILTASYLHRCLTEAATPGARAAFRTIATLGCVMGGLLAAASLLYAHFLDQIVKEFPGAPGVAPGFSPVAAAIILLVGSGWIVYSSRFDSEWHRIPWVAGAMIGAVMLIGLHVGVPRFNHYFIAPPQQLASIAGALLGPEDRLIVYGQGKASFTFYARRKVITIHRDEEATMIPLLAQPGITMVLLPASLRSRLPEEAQRYTVLGERHGYLLLSNRPMMGTPPSGTGHGAAPRTRREQGATLLARPVQRPPASPV